MCVCVGVCVCVCVCVCWDAGDAYGHRWVMLYAPYASLDALYASRGSLCDPRISQCSDMLPVVVYAPHASRISEAR